DFFTNEITPWIDYHIAPNDIAAGYKVRHGIPSDRIQTIGSARFCGEWQDVLGCIVPDGGIPENISDRLNVVYMERGADLHGPHRETIRQAIERVAALDYVHLAIKPHTRSDRLLEAQMPISATLAADANSVRLIDWADAVIGTNSSILVDVLIRGKVLVYPRFFHEDRMVFHEMNACATAEGSQDLESILHRLYHDRSWTSYYKREHVEALITTIVYAGDRGRDVLGECCLFIDEIATERLSIPTPQPSHEV
ncbi:unnamed protein product, partial [marine sediment metagenome]